MSDTSHGVQTVTVNDVELAYFDTGGDGPLALCLHGFPDSAHTWRHLLPRLADAGFRAVAPFLRGYAPSAVPADGRYQTAVLGLDANALHDALGAGPDAVLVGHDWGAMAAYNAANTAAGRWSKVVGLAVPPGGAAGEAFLTNPAQLKRSWYMFFFQHPLADLAVPANDLAFIDLLWSDWSPGFDATEDRAHVKAALRDPAHLQAALGYYRATLGDGYQDPALAEAQMLTFVAPAQPLLYLHGADDGCMGLDVARAAEAGLPATARMEVVSGTGHFLHLEQPDRVNGLIMDFVTGT